MRSKIGILLLLLCQGILIAQQEAKIDSLKKLGRDSLIKLAVKKLNEPGFDPKGYDRITVMAYKDKLVVEFSLSVKLIDGSCFYDRVAVSLIGSGTGVSIQGDCDEPRYHKFTSKEKKKVQFVFDAINKSDELGHLKDNILPEDDHMQITEKLTYYYVEVDDRSTHSNYKVDKLSGKISDTHHKHYANSSEHKHDAETIK